MDNLKQIIAKNISDLRKSNEMTQTELAEKLNYSDKAVSKWERGESIPDVTVLKEIADYFHVTLDYLVTLEHKGKDRELERERERAQLRAWIDHNHIFITAICMMLVCLLAVAVTVILGLIIGFEKIWVAIIYALPAVMIVWLVFNTLWFEKKRNFLIISLLMWSVILSLYLTFVVFTGIGAETWPMFLLGVPGQLIIIFWSKLRPLKQLRERLERGKKDKKTDVS